MVRRTDKMGLTFFLSAGNGGVSRRRYRLTRENVIGRFPIWGLGTGGGEAPYPVGPRYVERHPRRGGVLHTIRGIAGRNEIDKAG